MALMLPRATGKVWLCEEKADPEYGQEPAPRSCMDNVLYLSV
jgi:hypothetical protein